MAAKTTSTAAQVYQLKITLRHSKPPIWRRLLVPSDMNLAKLHHVIQEVMGWTDSHLHQFKIGNIYYGTTYPDDFGGMPETRDERKARLNMLVSRLKAKFIYEYDFGDSWEHDVVLEKILPPESGIKYPLCIAGKRACPPEDCGGVWGYDNLLETIKDPNHPEHEDMVEWLGGDFDPEAFDVEAVNTALRRIR
ncbi:MAG: plasmid pRiA4b ORF-3 family protein [Deltaproteobacteria bacterium]|nr:plasmid pRiA4b ORF-3 family protein [Deltaproteobacteria bacterium]